MRGMPENSADTCITDPPYELGFMGKKWDSSGISFQPDTWREVYRVLKPGAMLLAFGGTRTVHRIACAIEDAGFEIRDMIAWVYSTGFPKSHNISKALDKRAGAEREVVGHKKNLGHVERGDSTIDSQKVVHRDSIFTANNGTEYITAPATPEARLWDGWGTALKPSLEPIVVAMKPIEGTYAENALKWGCAGLNIDGARVEVSEKDRRANLAKANKKQTSNNIISGFGNNTFEAGDWGMAKGRFPANLIHDGSDEVVGLFPNSKGSKLGTKYQTPRYTGNTYNGGEVGGGQKEFGFGDSGSAARFFYVAKASRSERNAGLEGMPLGEPPKSARSKPAEGRQSALGLPRQNTHPTVKPIALMRYLCQLTKTPTGGVVLDPFAGSGTTLVACARLGRKAIGIDNDEGYFDIAVKRVQREQQQMKLF